MPVINPPYALQGGAINHDAILFRRVVQGLFTPDGEGVSRFNGLNDLKVVQNSPAGMSVLVSRGGGYVKGDNVTDQGFYFVYNDGNAAQTIGTADLTNPRIDLVVAEIRDNFYSVAGDDWRLRVVQGTPAGSPTAPALPTSAIPLAEVRVNANATSITDANITDKRNRILHQGGVFINPSTARPTGAYEGQVMYETDADRLAAYDGTSWIAAGGSKKLAETRISGTSTHTITWSGIPTNNAHYNHLLIVWRGARTGSGASGFRLKINNDATANYRYLFVNGSTASATPNTAWSTSETDTEIGVLGSTHSSGFATLPNYASSDGRSPTGVSMTQYDDGSVFGWRNHVYQTLAVSSINRIDLYPTEGAVNFANGFYASLHAMA